MTLEQLLALLAQRRKDRDEASAKVGELIQKASKEKKVSEEDAKAREEADAIMEQCQKDIRKLQSQIDELNEEAARAAKPVDKPIDPPNPSNEQAGGKRPHLSVGKEQNHFACLGDFIAAAAGKGDARDMAVLHNMNDEYRKAGGDTRILAPGAFLIPPNWSSELHETGWKTGQITNMITPQPITVGNDYHYLDVNDKDLSTGSAAGGLQWLWFDEGEDMTYQDVSFEDGSLSLKEGGFLFAANDNMLLDGPALEAYVRRNAPVAQGFAYDKKVLFGVGTKSPQGMLADQNEARIKIDKETTQPKYCVENFNKMYARLPQHLVDRAIWVFHPQAMEHLPTLTNAAGTAVNIYSGPMMGYDQKQIRASLLGIPIVYHNSAKAVGTLGDCALIVPSEYTMITKGNMMVDMSIHVEFVRNKTVFRFRARVNGKPSWKRPIKVENGGFTQSPYIVLGGGR